MDNEKMKKYVETVLYVLDRAGGMDQYHLYKVLFFAQQRALKEYGVQLLPEDLNNVHSWVRNSIFVTEADLKRFGL